MKMYQNVDPVSMWCQEDENMLYIYMYIRSLKELTQVIIQVLTRVSIRVYVYTEGRSRTRSRKYVARSEC